MKVFITGVSGFLGRNLAQALAERGHAVEGSARRTGAAGGPQVGRLHQLSLGQPMNAAIFQGCHAVVHCAHDFTPGSRDRNVRGTRQIATSAHEQGVTSQVFISSYSAHAQGKGEYAEAKWTLETWFLERGETVLKPGLVIGDGGMFARLRNAVDRLPVVPLIDGGRGEVPVVALRDFVAATIRVLESGVKGLKRLYRPPLATLRELLEVTREVTAARTLFLPIPFGVVFALVQTLERGLRVRLPVGLESLRAFAANQGLSEGSDLFDLVAEPVATLQEMIRDASR